LDSLNRYITPEYVGERLKLAAETDKKMPRVGPAHVKSGHPATLTMVNDAFMFGENWRENLKLKIEAFTRVAPTRESMREMDEAMGWLQLIGTVERRRALWAWACGFPDSITARKVNKSRRLIGYWRDVDLKTIANNLNG
jgi:hypothetical protein